ncbi:MAG: DUF4339 domain-containing protein [Verrucomicrobiota bacterium]
MSYIRAVAHPFFLTPTSKQTLYYYNNSNNEPVGPLAIEKLRDMFQSSQLGPHVWVIEKGGSDWTRLADLLAANPLRQQKKTTPAPFVKKTVEPVYAKVSSNMPAPSFVAAQHKVAPVVKTAPVATIEPAIPTQAPLYASRPIFIQPEPSNIEPIQAPMSVQIVAVLSFISGFANIFGGMTWAAMGIFFLKVNLLVALIPAAFGLIAGIYNIIFASKLISSQPSSRPMARYLSLLDIASISILNVLACGIGVINFLILTLSPFASSYFPDSSNSSNA